MRLLIFFALIYFGYKVVKSYLKSSGVFKDISSGKFYFGNKPDGVDDIMIQDPLCKVYFPKRDGVHLRYKGKNLYFCSRECKEKFIDMMKKA